MSLADEFPFHLRFWLRERIVTIRKREGVAPLARVYPGGIPDTSPRFQPWVKTVCAGIAPKGRLNNRHILNYPAVPSGLATAPSFPTLKRAKALGYCQKPLRGRLQSACILMDTNGNTQTKTQPQLLEHSNSLSRPSDFARQISRVLSPPSF
jgi:hypothetical protein